MPKFEYPGECVTRAEYESLLEMLRTGSQTIQRQWAAIKELKEALKREGEMRNGNVLFATLRQRDATIVELRRDNHALIHEICALKEQLEKAKKVASAFQEAGNNMLKELQWTQ